MHVYYLQYTENCHTKFHSHTTKNMEVICNLKKQAFSNGLSDI